MVWVPAIITGLILFALGLMWGTYLGSRRRASGAPQPVGTPPPAQQMPQSAGHEEPDPPDVLTRRSFLRNVFYAASGAIAIALAYPAVRYFLYPALRKQGAQQFTSVAPLTDFPVGVPTFVAFEERAQDGWTTETRSKGAWVVYRGGVQVVVFDPHCTHLGCGYSWHGDRKQFLCPCHGGVFDINGNVLAGPPPRPLDHMEHQVVDGTLLVGRTVRAS